MIRVSIAAALLMLAVLSQAGRIEASMARLLGPRLLGMMERAKPWLAGAVFAMAPAVILNAVGLASSLGMALLIGAGSGICGYVAAGLLGPMMRD